MAGGGDFEEGRITGSQDPFFLDLKSRRTLETLGV